MRTTDRIAKLTLVVAVVVAVVTLASRFGSALHFQTPKFLQVTFQTTGTVDAITTWNPQFWGFTSSGDVLGNGNNTPQIFFFNQELRVLGGQFGVTQVTCVAANPNHPSMSRTNLLVFEADGGLCADPLQNCDPLAHPTTGRQIFAYHDDTGFIQQLTRCPGDCTNPNISGNGHVLAFESNIQLIGGGGVGTVTELYQANLRQLGNACPQFPCGNANGPASSGFRRLTNGGGQNASQSNSGKYVAFESTGDLTNNGQNAGLSRVYILNVQKNVLNLISTGGTTFEATQPSLNQGGRRVAYTQQVPVNGSPTPVRQIFLVQTSARTGAPVPKKVQQITHGTLDSFDPALDPPGRRLAFLSAADLLGTGVPGNQLYMHDSRINSLIQVTAGPSGVQLQPDITWGVFLGFISQDDYTGNGNTTPQFFVNNFFKNAPASLGSPFLGTQTPQITPTPSVTPTPNIGIPANIGMALVVNEAADNGDNTLTTVIAVTVSDVFGNPVPDHTLVQMSVVPPPGGVLVSNGATNEDPGCDVSRFEAKTGVTIVNRIGVAHVCVTYPGAVSGQTRTIQAISGPYRCVGGSTPDAPCENDGQCFPIKLCSTSIGTVCVTDPDCPGGGICELHTATCEPSAIEIGTLTLPHPHNDCALLLNGQPCSDFNPCTVGDVCGGGLPDRACVDGANDGLPCTSDVQCPDLYACLGGANNGNPCTNGFDCPADLTGPGTCALRSASAGCQLTTPPTCQPGTPHTCPDDGNACTDDVCNFYTGACGMPKECVDDANPCTDDVCDPLTGNCGIFNTAPCEDGNPCTFSDICATGICQPGTTIICPDDLNACTLDVCDPTTGKCGIRFEPCACSAL